VLLGLLGYGRLLTVDLTRTILCGSQTSPFLSLSIMEAQNNDQPNPSVLDTAFKRLHEAHRHWHTAQENYFDPEEFRMAMQSCIQTLRTVTFMLQASKRSLDGFDEWYKPQQEKMRSDSILRWLIEARNHIEKAGDLATYSQMTAKVIASYHDQLEVTAVEGDLFDNIATLLGKVPPCYLVGQVFEHGTLRVERRWVANTLPTRELLDALAHAYTELSQVLADACAHWSLAPWQASGIHDDEADLEMDERPSCMINRPEIIEAMISLKEAAPVHIVRKVVKHDETKIAVVAERYGPIEPPTVRPSTLEEHAKMLFGHARRVMKKDGYHIPAVFLFRGGSLVHMMQLVFGDRAAKYVLMRDVADIVQQLKADAIIHIGEAWTARLDPAHPFKYPSDASNRGEILFLMASTKDRSFFMEAEITRPNGDVELGETVEKAGRHPDMFSPVLKVWNNQQASSEGGD
jgi:hypothetical protein